MPPVPRRGSAVRCRPPRGRGPPGQPLWRWPARRWAQAHHGLGCEVNDLDQEAGHRSAGFAGGQHGGRAVDPVLRDGLRSGWLVERDAPKRGACGRGAQHADRADAVSEHVNRASVSCGQVDGHGGDVFELTNEAVGLVVAAAAPSASVHRRHPMVSGQVWTQRPHRVGSLMPPWTRSNGGPLPADSTEICVPSALTTARRLSNLSLQMSRIPLLTGNPTAYFDATSGAERR